MWSDAIVVTATVVMAFATGAVAWTAIQSLLRERKRDAERRRAIDAEMSAIAYALRRQLRSWWPDHTWPSRDHPEDQKRKAAQVIPHLDEAERRIEGLLALSSNASPEKSQAMREAAVKFYRAATFINDLDAADWENVELDGQGMITNRELPREIRSRFGGAFSLLLDTVKCLDQVIDAELQSAAEALPE